LPLSKKYFSVGLVSSDEYYGIIKVNDVQLYVRQDADFYYGMSVCWPALTRHPVKFLFNNFMVYSS